MLHPKVAFIYALIDPRTLKVRYVGKTDNPKERFLQHLEPNQLRVKSKKNSWLKSLLALGLKPKFFILETVAYHTWQEREKYWITYYRNQLTNLAEGGFGGVGYGLQNPFFNKRHSLQTKHHWATMRQGISYKKETSSVYIGVSWESSRCKWRATIQSRKILGRFDTEYEAAKVYDEAALKLYGPTARTNF